MCKLHNWNANVIPNISIIIPVYNTEKYLRECLNSIVNKTSLNIEIICVNDGSTDNSLNILKEYSEKYNFIKLISYKKNKGAGYARNKGLKIATGEFLAFLDSDDILNAKILEEIYLKCSKLSTDIGICSAESLNDLTNNSQFMQWVLRVDLLPNKDIFSSKDIYNYIFNFSQNWNWNKIFRNDFIKKNKIRFQKIYRTNDLLFTCKSLVLASKITTLNKPIVKYRINHGISCQQNNDFYPLDFYKAFKELRLWLKRVNLYEKCKKSFIEWALAGCVYNINSIIDFKNRAFVSKIVFTKGLKELDLINHKSCVIIDSQAHLNFDLMLKEFQESQKIRRKEQLQALFSVKNQVLKGKKHKVVTMLGIKIKLRRYS